MTTSWPVTPWMAAISQHSPRHGATPLPTAEAGIAELEGQSMRRSQPSHPKMEREAAVVANDW